MVPLRLAPPHVATRESGRPITEPPQKGYNVEIFDYMKARAESENVEHALPIGWYFTHLFMGVRSFFNVKVTKEGKVISDDENPAFFERWKKDRSRLHQEGTPDGEAKQSAQTPDKGSTPTAEPGDAVNEPSGCETVSRHGT